MHQQNPGVGHPNHPNQMTTAGIHPHEMTPGPYTYLPQHEMQPYSPCPQPQMRNGYPQGASLQSQPPMINPAFQQPPQLPGGYPYSPSRRPQSHHQNVVEWMDPYTQCYSPVPSVTPSVMSHGNMTPYDGSVMSIPSAMDCPTPDMRPNSVLSGMENVDPRMMMPNGQPAPPPQPISPQLLTDQILGFMLNPNNQAELTKLLKTLHYSYQSSEKKTEFIICAKLVPKLLQLLRPDLDKNLQYYLKQIIFLFVNNLPEKDLVQHLSPPVNIHHLAAAAFHPLLADKQLILTLDKVLEWRSKEAQLAKFRCYLRNPQFLDNLMKWICDPERTLTVIRLSVFPWLLSILCYVIGHSEDSQNYVLQWTLRDQNGQPMSPAGVVGILLVTIHRKCQEIISGKDQQNGRMVRYSEDETDVDQIPYAFKVVRQMINVLLTLSKTFKGCSRLAISHIIQYGGIGIILEYMHLVYTGLKNPKDYICKNGSQIIKQCCQEHVIKEYSSIIDPLTLPKMLLTLNVSHFVNRNAAGNVGEFLSDEDRPGSHLIEAVYHLIVNSEHIKKTAAENEENIRTFVEIMRKCVHWLSRCFCLRSQNQNVGMVDERRLKTSYNEMLDRVDTVICLLSKIFPLMRENARILDESSAQAILKSMIGLLEISDLSNSNGRQPVRRMLIMARSMLSLKPFSSTPILLTTVHDHKENIISVAFDMTGDNTCQIFSLLPSNKEKQELMEIVALTYGFLSNTWSAVESDANNEFAATIKGNIYLFIENKYTKVIMFWLNQMRCSEWEDANVGKYCMKRLAGFCRKVCEDAGVCRLWSNAQPFTEFFESLALSQDSELREIAQGILDLIQNSVSSMSNVVCSAMDL